MTSIFLQDPIYITVDQVKDSTSKPALAVLTDDEIKILIYKAQREVDSYLGSTFRPPFDINQEFIFPVLKDEVSYLPVGLTEATLYVVEQVYIAGDTINANVGLGDILEEKTGPHTIRYDKSSSVPGFLIPDIAKKLLNEYRNQFTGQYL